MIEVTAYILNLAPQLFEGLKMTALVFIVTLLLSIPLGMIVALLRLSKVKVVSEIIHIYIWIMRGTPLLLQIMIIFFGFPFIGLVFDRVPAVLIAFVLNYTAYFAEIFRAGLLSVDKGQHEAADALGFTRIQKFFNVILPQTIRIVIPPVANEVITLVKDTALVYIVGLEELLRVGQMASTREASLLPFVFVGAIYLAITAVFTKLFNHLERKWTFTKN
jgi:polar amino acid transport system permease protein